MATTNSRIAPYVPNFIQDNTGRTIGQSYTVATASSGTYSFYPSEQKTYLNFTSALTGNMALVINATASLICDELTVLLKGGASQYTVTISGDITGVTSSITIPASKNAVYQGVFNGTSFIGESSIQA